MMIVTGQQQTFRPFFDTRFTSTVGLLDFRRKSDPFSNVGNDGSSGYDHWSGYNNYSYLGYNPGMSMTSSYNPGSLASYGTAVLDPLLQASSLASAATAASAQTTSGMQNSIVEHRGLRSTSQWIIKYIPPTNIYFHSTFSLANDLRTFLQLAFGRKWVS